MNLFNLEGFEPQVIDEAYLKNLGVSITADDFTKSGLLKGSKAFKNRYENKTLFAKSYLEREIDLDEEIEIHNYTGKCPVNTFEVNPIKKGCDLLCMYCLVNDGEHHEQIILHNNYTDYLTKHVSTQGDKNVFYYFSPKSEAFQGITLSTGMAHNTLRVFVKHYEENPSSKVRIFIASKAGINQLNITHEGESILDLLIKLKGKVQFNTSIGIMPDELHDIYESGAAPVEERLLALKTCRENGINADSVLLQPILAPYLTDEFLVPFFKKLADFGIRNIKPEFLTVSMENLAMLSQFVGWLDKDAERQLLEMYISPDNKDHIKQRSRTAPSKDWCVEALKQIKEYTKEHSISISICYWVREQLGISTTDIPIVNENGYRCLGYQTKLFNAKNIVSIA